MNKKLCSYLTDHLAGATFAIELLKAIQNQDFCSEAAELAANLIEDVRSDKGSLEHLIEAYRGEPTSGRNLASWIAEKASHYKLDPTSPLGIFESIEFLCLGVLGKRELWEALTVSAGGESRWTAELERLMGRADDQHAKLNALRLRLAKELLQDWDRDVHCHEFEQALAAWAKGCGVEFAHRQFAAGKAGEFDGTTLTLNSAYGPRERLFYGVHALGSIAIWSRDRAMVQSMFDELRDAKKRRSEEPTRLAAAIERYRKFETESSEHAVWILSHIGATSEIPDYSNQMRADLEAMTQFHEIGTAPVWDEFFTRWNREIASGERSVETFKMKAVECFQAQRIEKQEILQRH